MQHLVDMFMQWNDFQQVESWKVDMCMFENVGLCYVLTLG